MQKLFNKSRTKKILIALLIVITCNFIIPIYSHAGIGGVLFDPIKMFVAFIGDSIMVLVNAGFSGEWIGVTTAQAKGEDNWKKYWSEGWFSGTIDWPTILITPEEIFTGKVLGLDVNFLEEKTEENLATKNGNYIDDDYRSQIIEEKKKIGTAGYVSDFNGLRANISKWYLFIRNLSVAALFCVLIYIGIRIVLSSASEEKAKYKSMIMNWVVALCLVFVLHYIMSLVMFTTDKLVGILSDYTNNNSSFTIKRLKDGEADEKFTLVKGADGFTGVDVDGDVEAKVYNLMEYVRVYVNAQEPEGICAVYLLIYCVLVAFTVIFIFKYLKRVMYMAFLTMIAPIIAFTYPLDKMKDGSAQAFNKWFIEYLFNALLQPLHLLIYVVLVSSAADLAKTNFIYSIVALAFISQAEKLLKEFFGLNRASTTSGSGGAFATGALASQAVSALKRGKSGGRDKSLPSGGSSRSGGSVGNSRLRQARGLDVYSSDSSSDGSTGGSSGNTLPQVGSQPEEWQEEEPGPWQKTRMSKEEYQEKYGNSVPWKLDDENDKSSNSQDTAKPLNEVGNAPQLQDNGNKKKIKGYKNGRIASVVKAGGKAAGRGIKYTSKKLGRGAIRTAAAIPGAVVGGMIGGAMSIATGNAKYLVGGIGAGAALTGKAANVAFNAPNKIRTAYRKERLGSQAAEAKARVEEFIKDKDNVKYIKQQHNLSSDKKAKDYIKNNASDYIGAGYTNVEDVSRLIKTKETMQKHGINMTTDQIMAADQTSKEFKYDELMNGEKSLAIQDGLTKQIMSINGGNQQLAEENARNHMNTMRVARGLSPVSKEQELITRDEIKKKNEEQNSQNQIQRISRRTGGRTDGRTRTSGRISGSRRKPRGGAARISK